MSAQRPASPELGADDVADARYPNTARIWNYQLGGKDNFPVDRKAPDAANAMVRDISAPIGEDAAHDGLHLLRRMVDYLLGQGPRPRCPSSRFPARPPSRRRPGSESSRVRATPRPGSRAARRRACEW
jgi:hypothetical protein